MISLRYYIVYKQTSEFCPVGFILFIPTNIDYIPEGVIPCNGQSFDELDDEFQDLKNVLINHSQYNDRIPELNPKEQSNEP